MKIIQKLTHKISTPAMALPLICLITFLIYGEVLQHDWLNWDDPWLVLDNKILHNFSWSTIKTIFCDLSKNTRLQLGAEYLPLRDLSVMLSWSLHGKEAAGFLATNLLLYLLAIPLLFKLFESFSNHRWLALFATLLFAVHPIHVESVAWISTRKDVLALLFSLLSLVSFETFLKNERRSYLVATLLFYWCALGSKYTTITLPAFWIFRLLYLHYSDEKFILKRSLWIQLLVPTLLILLIQLKIIFKVDHLIQLSGYSTSDQIGTSLLIMGDVFRRYFYNLIMPIALSVTYITPEITLSSMKGIATLIFILSIFILLFFLVYWANEKTYRKKISPWLFWIAWFFAALLPVSQLVGLENKMADRYLLFPSLSYAFLLPYGFYQAYTNQWLKQKTSTVLLFMVALFYATLTFQQVSFWKNSEILWLHAVQLEPQDQKALYQLSMNYKDQRLLDRERVVLEVLLQVNPQHEKALNNYAINLYQQNPADPKILSTYQQLIKINPKNTKALQNYGFILLKRGDHAQAITLLLQAIQHDPNYCLALEHLSEAYLAAKNKSEATIYADRTQGCKEKNAAR